jgi:hypothetical protein
MRTQEDRDADLAIGRLIEAYDEYVDLLTKSEAAMIGLAFAHGFRCSEEMIEQGAVLRARIAELKQAVLAPKQ